MKLPPAARYSLAAVAFLTPAAWLLMLLACVKYGSDWPATCQPVNYAAAPLAVAAGVWAVMGVVYLRRAYRRATKGMWRRVNPGGWRVMERVVRVAWGSEDDPPGLIAGEARFERRRWLIPCPNGQDVWVDRAEFWRWLRDGVEPLHATLPPGHSAISKRHWRGRKFQGRKLQEGDVLAFREILKAIKAVDYRTKDARSMYYIPAAGAVWGRVEEFEKIQESEVY